MMKVIMSVMMAIGMMSCGNVQKTISIADLAGEWEIVEVNGNKVNAEETPFLGFNVDENQLYGNAGCNSLMGMLETDANKPGSLSFGTVGSTKRMCADMATEDAVLQALGQVKAFSLNEGALILADADGNELIELKKRP